METGEISPLFKPRPRTSCQHVSKLIMQACVTPKGRRSERTHRVPSKRPPATSGPRHVQWLACPMGIAITSNLPMAPGPSNALNNHRKTISYKWPRLRDIRLPGDSPTAVGNAKNSWRLVKHRWFCQSGLGSRHVSMHEAVPL